MNTQAITQTATNEISSMTAPRSGVSLVRQRNPYYNPQLQGYHSFPQQLNSMPVCTSSNVYSQWQQVSVGGSSYYQSFANAGGAKASFYNGGYSNLASPQSSFSNQCHPNYYPSFAERYGSFNTQYAFQPGSSQTSPHYVYPQKSSAPASPINPKIVEVEERVDTYNQTMRTKEFNVLVKEMENKHPGYDPQKTYREWDEYNKREMQVKMVTPKKKSRVSLDGRKGNLLHPVTDENAFLLQSLPKRLLHNGCDKCGLEGESATICEYHADKDSLLTESQAQFVIAFSSCIDKGKLIPIRLDDLRKAATDYVRVHSRKRRLIVDHFKEAKERSDGSDTTTDKSKRKMFHWNPIKRLRRNSKG